MKNQKKEKVPFSRAFKNNVYLIKTAYHSDKVMVIMRLVMGFFTGLNHGLSLFFVNEILNALDRGEGISRIFTLIGLMFAYTLAYELFYAWYYKLVNPLHKLNFIKIIHKQFFVKASKLDLECYDTPEFYNDFVYSMQNCDKSIVNTVDQLADLIRSVVASVSVFAVLINVDIIIAFVILAFAIVNMFISILQNGIYYRYNIEMNELWRKEWYIRRFFSLADYAKEIRLTDVGENMLSEYGKNIELQRRADMKVSLKGGVCRFLLSLSNISSNIFILLYMAYHLMVTNTVLLGGFAVTVAASWKLKGLVDDIQEKLINMNKDSLYADKVRKFLESEQKIKSGEKMLDKFESLEFKNVSFAYGEINVLENVSFKVGKGERIAFVGYNGAGKTTTTKLIMRLYDVSSGEILVNGVNIKEYNLDSLREKIGAVFQDYKVFAATVAENVLGDIYTPDKEQTVLEALKDSTFGDKLEKLPDGINTQLTREFYDTGTNLSGGENQKIAIARVFAHNNELIIMDEPSSALDPIAEYNLNVGIDKNAKNKTVVFIAHRLSTTRHANRIYMFEKGRIVEQGSHDELIRKDGKYAHMFNLQAQKYRTEQMNIKS